MTNDEPSPLAREIRVLAGKLAADTTLEKSSDSEEYDFQVQIGLADAVVDILDFNPYKLGTWFGYCLIALGLEIDDRLEGLLHALRDEVELQVKGMEEDPPDDA